MARKNQTPVTQEDAWTGRRTDHLRLRERGGLTPSLKQFLDLVEFHALEAQAGPTAKPEDDLRAQAVAAERKR